ncbi:MAG: condensation domain-containing protein, partial [Thermoanaerobaculia bacterium]
AHRGAVSLAAAQQRLFGAAPGDRVLLFASPSFDASVWETWMALAAGATLELAAPAALLPGPDLASLLRRRRVTHLTVPPSALAALAPEPLPDLACLVVAGEACPAEVASRWSAGRRFFNAYGPTEATVCATIEECGPERRRPPIGRPLDRTRVYVLGRGLEVAPIGVVAELYVGGVGVARGYLGRPALTAERFVPDPFADRAGERLYRTGDRVRWLADERLDFVGRADHQLKVRGFRIEPGEIEAALVTHPQVRECVVVAPTVGDGPRRLTAYVAAAGRELAATLREHLRRRLPEHMVPALFVPVAALPRTPAGKIDRAALPPPVPSAALTAAPESDGERALAAIWGELLGVEQVGRHDNFFELGGDSILSIQAVSRAAAAGLHLAPRDLFEHPTVAAAAAVAGSVPRGTAVATGPVSGPCPLTPAQRWFFELEIPVPGHWNLALEWTSAERLRRELVAAALTSLVDHHDALRARFHHDAGGWRQEIAAPGEAGSWRAVDLSQLAVGEQRRAVETEAAALHSSLDLTAGPVFAAILFDLGAEGGSRLVLVAHHLLVDAVSWRLLLEDLASLYRSLARGETPAPLPRTTSLPQWSAHLERWARSSAARRQLPLWRRTLEAAAGCRLPLEAAPAALTEASAASFETALGAADTEALATRVAEAYATRPDEVILAALAEAFATWTGDRRLFLQREGHGRDGAAGFDLSRIVGWLTSAWPVVLDLRRAEGPEEVLVTAKEQLRAVPDGGLGWGALRYLGDAAIVRELAAGPVPRLAFNYLGRLDAAAGSGLAPAAEAPGAPRHPGGRLPFPLEVSAWVRGGRLRLRWSWGAPALPRATVERLAAATLTALSALVAHCLSPGAGRRTPSDFPLAQVDQQDLDRLLTRLGERSGSPTS